MRQKTKFPNKDEALADYFLAYLRRKPALDAFVATVRARSLQNNQYDHTLYRHTIEFSLRRETMKQTP